MRSPGAPCVFLGKSALHRGGDKATWPVSRLWQVLDPTLFRMTLVAVLLAPVRGDCDPPPIIPFASPINPFYDSSFKPGTTLKYNCHAGYKKINSTWISCNANGEWNYNVFCAKKQCKNPGELINGKVEVKTDFHLGSIIEFRCLRGYILVGSATSRCEVHGKGVSWSDHIPECVIVKCEAPPTISNGKHNGIEAVYTYGSTVTYSCDLHYSLLGQASISCVMENTTTGVWSPNPPTCKKIFCYQPQIPNGIFVSGFGSLHTYKDVIVIKCKKGYALRGSSRVHCEANNEWHPSVPTCELNSCIDLPELPFASWEKTAYTSRSPEIFEVGTELKFKCDPGYRVIPAEPLTVKCQENLTWSPSKGCERVCCPTPDMEKIIIISDRRDFTGICVYAYGDYVSFMCDKGYYPISPDGRSSCQADGTWNPKMPECEPDCLQPPSVAHGRHRVLSTTPSRQEIMYECEEGYTLVGERKLFCIYSRWLPRAPVCQALCPKPEIANGNLSVVKAQYGEKENLTVRCNSGYGVVGSPSITCAENRNWQPEVPKCEWEVPEGCEQVLAGRRLMQCLAEPNEVKMALEVYKLSLEIELLELQRDKARNSVQLPL
ncbi:zona pellucida sperm-binding protein 3 receptor-like [Lepus europaeus]|uniref:zona pellucida sperm-binding protein 3 receptor-like n=1 Tax=Lepus europaeus TaxID=9983 RepID=UPI002B48385B|nr:zona pellucida sperm-binding protein 3 receptor-like [Lepus europaeus]